MIRYALTCERNHGFESWFQSAEAFDRLKMAGRISCANCGSTTVEKALMSPAVRQAAETAPPSAPSNALSQPANEVEKKLAALRRQIEEQSDYVGLNFVSEARAMHDGDKPNRAIYGEARADEARKLIEDGVPVAPLPFMPVRKVN